MSRRLFALLPSALIIIYARNKMIWPFLAPSPPHFSSSCTLTECDSGREHIELCATVIRCVSVHGRHGKHGVYQCVLLNFVVIGYMNYKLWLQIATMSRTPLLGTIRPIQNKEYNLYLILMNSIWISHEGKPHFQTLNVPFPCVVTPIGPEPSAHVTSSSSSFTSPCLPNEAQLGVLVHNVAFESLLLASRLGSIYSIVFKSEPSRTNLLTHLTPGSERKTTNAPPFSVRWRADLNLEGDACL